MEQKSTIGVDRIGIIPIENMQFIKQNKFTNLDFEVKVYNVC